ncbi:MAG: hypothetical protein A2065_02955 [Alphaproteobacteria bacterium GWB1_45_5]|nr:MAG: hypothetical protein A2065_02955 [Alphaproteobacteria bacterium GWB1_45_5]
MLLQIHEPGKTPDLSKKNGLVVGIDFGTTNSVVAISHQGKAEIVPLEGDRLVPSVIGYKDGTAWVGRKAQQERGLNVIRSIKRSMEPQSLQPKHDKNSIEISADILRYLKTEAEKSLKETITGAVLTVPAYYSEVAREATRAAAHLAGIPILRLINEPTAAALAYHLDEQEEGVSLIYDLGGGTFDVSVLQLHKGIFQVLAVRGDMVLGGDDLDKSLFKFLVLTVGEILESEGLLLARQIKEHLTTDLVWEGEIRGKKIQITRDILNQLVSPFIEKTLHLCGQALQEAGVIKQELKFVVLVGGSTRLPIVRDQIEQFFGKKPLSYVNPDEVVSLGAALHAESLRDGKGKLLLDVTPFALGIETLGNTVEIIIPPNSPLPCSVSQLFTTAQDGQTKIKIHIVQGTRKTLENCSSLATFVLANIPPSPAGYPQLKVIFTLDADGILSVFAEEQRSHTRHMVQAKPTYKF